METETVAPAGLRLLSVCRVAPEPAPPTNVKAKLSFLDAPWVSTPPIQEVFLYQKGGGAEYGGIVKRLKESLAASLALYLPFAGKLTYVQETRDVVVDFSDPGVAFFEAEAMAGCIDLSRLAGDDADGDVPAMELGSLLVPEHDVRVLPAPVLIVQVTRLNPGLAIGISVHHAAADGRAFNLFMNAWSSMSRGGASPVTVTNQPLISPPNYSREAIAHPSSDELAREVLSKVAPNLPLANTMEEDAYLSQHYRLRHRAFLFGADDIRTLRQHIDGLEVMANKNKPVSAFVALSALSWVAFVRAKGLAAGEDTYLVFQVDLRARLRPAVDAGYVGNCVRACIASADAGELLGDMGLLHASRAIKAAVKEAVEAPLDRIGEWMERLIALPAARLANIGGSPQFRVYQTADFGFGMPHKVVPLSMAGSPETSSGHVSMNDDNGGRMVLTGGKRDGDVRLSVSLDPVFMDAFKNNVGNDIRPTRRSRL